MTNLNDIPLHFSDAYPPEDWKGNLRFSLLAEGLYQAPDAEDRAAFARIHQQMEAIQASADYLRIRKWHGNLVFYAMGGQETYLDEDQSAAMVHKAEQMVVARHPEAQIVTSWAWQMNNQQGVSVVIKPLKESPP